MSVAAIMVRPCECGAQPKFKCERVAEDCFESWVECPACGRRGDYVEDWRGDDPERAADCWNAGPRNLPPAEMGGANE